MDRDPVTHSVVPAQFGWTVVTPEFDENKLFRTPVIGWLMEVYQLGDGAESYVTTIPVTCTGSVEDVAYYALQFGEGPFFTHFGSYEDEPEIWAYFRDEEKHRAALAASTIRNFAS